MENHQQCILNIVGIRRLSAVSCSSIILRSAQQLWVKQWRGEDMTRGVSEHPVTIREMLALAQAHRTWMTCPEKECILLKACMQNAPFAWALGCCCPWVNLLVMTFLNPSLAWAGRRSEGKHSIFSPYSEETQALHVFKNMWLHIYSFLLIFAIFHYVCMYTYMIYTHTHMCTHVHDVHAHRVRGNRFY